MELKQILELIKSPEKILDVPTMEKVIDYCTFWIHTTEEELMEKDFEVNNKLKQLIDREEKVNRAEALLKLEPVYMEKKRIELTLSSLKNYRQNIRRKRDRIIPR